MIKEMEAQTKEEAEKKKLERLFRVQFKSAPRITLQRQQ